MRDQIGLARHHRFQERAIGIGRRGRVGVMPPDGMVRQQPQRLDIVPGSEVLKRAHPDVARGHAGQDGARGIAFPVDGFPRGDRRQRPCRGDTQRRHGLADQVLPQHRSQCRPAIAAAGKRSRPRPFQLDVAPGTVAADDLAQQDGPSIAELGHEIAKLVPGIGQRDRRRAVRHIVASENSHTVRAGQGVRIEAQLLGQRRVHPYQPRRRDRRWGQPGVEPLW